MYARPHVLWELLDQATNPADLLVCNPAKNDRIKAAQERFLYMLDLAGGWRSDTDLNSTPERSSGDADVAIIVFEHSVPAVLLTHLANELLRLARYEVTSSRGQVKIEAAQHVK